MYSLLILIYKRSEYKLSSYSGQAILVEALEVLIEGDADITYTSRHPPMDMLEKAE